MNQQTVVSRVASLNTHDAKASEAFLASLSNEAREGPRALVGLWATPVPGVRRERVMVLIPELEDLAVQPLLDVPVAGLSPADHAWLIHAIAEAEVNLRNTIIKRGLALLGDTTPVPQPELPHSEGQPLPRRICDEAYLVLRELMKLGEDSQEAALNADAFLSLLENRRDEEIKKLKTSKTFTQFAD